MSREDGMSLTLEPTVKEKPGEGMSLAEQAALEGALAAALTPALSAGKPSDQFVAQLGQQLAAAADRELGAEQRRERQLRTAGLVGLAGGLFSLVGGVVVWLLWRQRRKPESAPATKPAVA